MQAWPCQNHKTKEEGENYYSFLQLLFLTYYSYTIIEHPFYKSFHDVTTTPQIILFISALGNIFSIAYKLIIYQGNWLDI